MITYADVVRGKTEKFREAAVVKDYIEMLMNPSECDDIVRYPDETLVPTATIKFNTFSTFTSTGANFQSFMGWKVVVGTLASFQTIAPSTAGTDYGGPQSTWSGLSAIDRTLACGIKVSLIGLPTSSFMPTGSLYFLQMQNNEITNFNTALNAGQPEAYCLQAVTAGKGFCCTVNELQKHGGAMISYLPEGPMSFVFSDTYQSAAAAGSTANQPIAINGRLYVIGFGVASGTVFRQDFTHLVEYIPTPPAVGLIRTHTERPSVSERENIAVASSSLSAMRSGKTSLAETPISDVGSATRIAGIVAKHTLGRLPGIPLIAEGVGEAGRERLPPWLSSVLAAVATR